MTRHFCCRLTPSGIGDQLSQLNRLHDLGRSFGLEYLYREPPRNRWSPDFDAADFLGLGLGEQRLDDFADHELISVDGAAASRALHDGRPLESLLPAKLPVRAIVEFVHSNSMYAHWAPSQLRHPINVREKFLQRHGGRIPRRHSPDQLSVCMHIRQGDCTWVRHGDRYVFLGMRKITADPRDVDLRRAPHPDDYAPVLADVAARLAGRPWSLTVFSDGPTNIFLRPPRWCGVNLYWAALREPRLMGWLRLARGRHPLHAFYNPMCDEEIVRGHEQSQNALQRLVAPYPTARLVIGTSRPLTEEAILAFVTSDVAVMGRSRAAFPLLGMGDPVQQAVLLLNQSRDENFDELDRVLAHH